jgi:hypothetical protein
MAIEAGSDPYERMFDNIERLACDVTDSTDDLADRLRAAGLSHGSALMLAQDLMADQRAADRDDWQTPADEMFAAAAECWPDY